MPSSISDGPLDGRSGKYIVSKADGSPVDPQARYIVLRIDGGPWDHLAERHALRAYIRRLREDAELNPDFGKLADHLESFFEGCIK